MSQATVQFIEIARERHAYIELLKEAAQERGEIAENLLKALQNGDITQLEYDMLKRELLGV